MSNDLYFDDNGLTRGNHTSEFALKRINQLPEVLHEHVETNDPCRSYVNPGWVQLVIDLHNEIVAIAPEYRLNQVKEKFGGLRFYTNIRDATARDIISKYEALSETVCDVCGAPGKKRSIERKYIATRCDDHNKG